MAKYARISESLSAERFENFGTDPDVPKHKRRRDGGLFIRPVVEGRVPEIDGRIERVISSMTVERDRVLVSYSVERIPIDGQILAVKAEAQRRIYDRFPQWRQANMTARAVELLRIGEANWSDAERDDTSSLDAGWAWIKSVREASGAIEAMSPIPSDFYADKWWPA